MQKFDYITQDELQLSQFCMLPNVLFSDERFSELSYSAKLLYAFLLDRTSLSRKNGWIDKDGHIYIYFTVEAVTELMGIGMNKAVKLFRELDSDHGCGLIIKKKQGQGKPDRIYVLNCESPWKKCGKSVENLAG